MNPKFSFIVVTYKRAGELSDLLEDMDKFQRNDFEVVVFNDGGDFDAENVISVDRRFPLKGLRSTERLNSCRTRNKALEQAVGEWVIFLDDDVRLKPDFLELINQAVSVYPVFSCRINNQRSGKKGVLKKIIEKNFTGKVFSGIGHFVAGFDVLLEMPVRVEHLPGAMMVFKRSLIGNTRFDEFIGEGTGYLDDADFSFSIYKKGIDMWYLPQFSVKHLQSPRGGNRELDKQKWFYHYLKHKLYFFKKHFAVPRIFSVYVFGFIETVIRSFMWRKNLLPVFIKVVFRL